VCARAIGIEDSALPSLAREKRNNYSRMQRLRGAAQLLCRHEAAHHIEGDRRSRIKNVASSLLAFCHDRGDLVIPGECVFGPPVAAAKIQGTREVASLLRRNSNDDVSGCLSGNDAR